MVQHPAYRQRLGALCAVANLDTIPVEERSPPLKELMRDAAKHARDVMFDTLPNPPAAVMLRLSSIARAVYMADSKLFHKLVVQNGICGARNSPTRRAQQRVLKQSNYASSTKVRRGRSYYQYWEKQ